MRKTVVAVAVLVLLATGGYALYQAVERLPEAVLSLDPPRVVDVDLSWGPAEGRGSVLLAAVTVENPNPVGGTLRPMTLTVAVNGERIGVAVLDEPHDIPREGKVTLPFRSVLDDGVSPRMLASRLFSHERTVLAVEGTGTVEVAGVPVPFPVNEERVVPTDDLLSLAKSPRSCDRTMPEAGCSGQGTLLVPRRNGRPGVLA